MQLLQLCKSLQQLRGKFMTTTEKEVRDTLALEISGEGKKNYSVQAGAGAGKTTMLSKRICRQIILGTPIEGFVVITYTNAAAAELRDKITTELGKAIKNGNLNENEMENAKSAFNNIEMMQVSTIHSFLFKILKEYAFEAGISIDVRMLEDEEDIDRKQAFFDKWYGEHFADFKEYRSDWKIQSESSKRYTDFTKQVFQNMFMDLANIREQVFFDTSDHSSIIKENADNYIEKWLLIMRSVSEAIKDNQIAGGKEKKLNKESKKIVDCVDALLEVTDDSIDKACKLSEAIENLKIIKEKNKNVYSRNKESFPDIDTAIDDAYCELTSCDEEWNFGNYYDIAEASRKAAKVVEYVVGMQKEYQKQIDMETKVISNDDILYRAEKLLMENRDILDKLRQQYSKIYVDEFQDTTGVQTRIIRLLSGIHGSELMDNMLMNDKLLFVGDPKQSIYRFTGAEKAVYDEMDELLEHLPEEKAESVKLNSNFRSNSAVVEWVNRCFSALMPGYYENMYSDWKIKEEKSLFGVYGYDYNEEGRYNKGKDVENVVELVKSLVGNPNVVIEGRNQTKLEMVKYSDIMIICKVTTDIGDFVRRFAQEGIPVNVQGKFYINDNEILKNFVLLVEYFANPKNIQGMMAAVQVLCGIDVTSVDSEYLEECKNKLYELKRQFAINRLNSDDILQYLLTHEELYIHKEYDIAEVRSYRIKLHQMVETCSQNNDGDLRTLANLLQTYLDGVVKREIPLESNENALRLMNVHQAKGLTSKIVIIANRKNEVDYSYNGFKKLGTYYPAVRYRFNEEYHSKETNLPAYGYDISLLMNVCKEELEEQIRLEYVAATRAANALIIMPPIKDNAWFTSEAYSYNDLRESHDIKKWIEDRNSGDDSFCDGGANACSDKKRVTYEELKDNIKDADMTELQQKQYISLTPSSLEKTGVTGYTPKDEGYIKEERPVGSIFGTIMHRIYQILFENYKDLVILDESEKNTEFKSIINQVLLENEEDLDIETECSSYMAFLKPKMLDYFTRIIMPIVENAEDMYPEYNFSFWIKDEEKDTFLQECGVYLNDTDREEAEHSNEIWINGQADLVVKLKNGVIKVYDYKSDAMNGKPMDDFTKELQQKYEGQLALYRYSIKKAFNVDNVETELIHLYM